jgi:hypothetical protein
MTRSVQSVHVFRHALLVTALCLVTFFAGLGRSAIGDADEAFYAQSAREMVEQGDWITPHYNYEYRFQKPVFFYWLVAIAYSVVGIGETAARFPSALAGLLEGGGGGMQQIVHDGCGQGFQFLLCLGRQVFPAGTGLFQLNSPDLVKSVAQGDDGRGHLQG